MNANIICIYNTKKLAAYLRAEQNSKIVSPWTSNDLDFVFTENSCLKIHNNNNDRLTAFDPGQPG